jgi:hypothetical protein
VTRRIEQVEGNAFALERHHAGRDRDAALLLDLHPVRPRTPRLPARFDLTRKVNGATLKQQLFGKRGLARVGVRDDREGTAFVGHGAARLADRRLRVHQRSACANLPKLIRTAL